jgi:hypothetical protein
MVSAAFSVALEQEQVKLIELYTIELSSGTTYNFTDHDADFSWDADYISLPLERAEVRYGTNLESDAVDVALANISAGLYDVAHKHVLDAAKVTIKLVRWDDSGNNPAKQHIVFIGSPDVELDRATLRISLRSILDSLNIMVPRHIYQESCNHGHYDDNCALTLADYAYAGTVSSGSELSITDVTRGTVYKVAFDAGDDTAPIAIGDALSGGVGAGTAVCANVNYQTATTGFLWYVEQAGVQYVDDEVITGGGNTVTINGTPAEDVTLYERGEIEFVTGLNAGARRSVMTGSGSAIVLAWPLIYTVSAGDTYRIYPGCDLRVDTCLNRFANTTNFRGHLYVPKWEDTAL